MKNVIRVDLNKGALSSSQRNKTFDTKYVYFYFQEQFWVVYLFVVAVVGVHDMGKEFYILGLLTR